MGEPALRDPALNKQKGRGLKLKPFDRKYWISCSAPTLSYHERRRLESRRGGEATVSSS